MPVGKWAVQVRGPAGGDHVGFGMFSVLRFPSQPTPPQGSVRTTGVTEEA